MVRAVCALAAALLALSGAVGSARAAPKASDLVQAELVAEPRAVEAGKAFTVAVRLLTREHWHTYWRNPGDSGLATEIAWTLPPGFSAGPIQWPTPSRIPVSHLVNYGYEGETSLLIEITPPASLPAGGSVAVKAAVTYLVCERECIPGEAALATTLPVAGGATSGGPDPSTRYIFEAARASLTVAAPGPASLSADGDRLRLRVEAAAPDGAASGSAYFFPFDETAIEHAAAQPLMVEGRSLVLSLKRSGLATGPAPAELPGVLVVGGQAGPGAAPRSFQIGSAIAPTATATSPVTAAARMPVDVDLSWTAIAGTALFAVLGGLILNLMPCVFPVLSIKVMSLVRHSGEGPAAIRLSGFAYTAGVLASFLALAGVLLGLRAGGAEIGWGFQLQSPAVVAGLAFLLFAMGLSLSGAVEFGTSLAGRAASVGSGHGVSGSFLTGVLAAVVATPCTAPFMGAAIGYALTAPAAVALVVFAALGLGMAAPFLILTLRPSLLSRLPRPGGWMDRLKQVLAFPVYATVAWLVFVLSQQVGPTGLFAALLGLVLVGFAAWCWRVSAGSDGWGRRVGQGLALASAAALVAMAATLATDRSGASGATASLGEGVERFTQARLDQLRREGRPVFVNMTAAWCITCIVNERTVLSAAAVKDRFERSGLVYLKGDWTNQDPEITRLLEQHGRSGVPLYVVYPAGPGDGVVLPQILTQASVLESLSGLPSATRRASLSP